MTLSAFELATAVTKGASVDPAGLGEKSITALYLAYNKLCRDKYAADRLPATDNAIMVDAVGRLIVLGRMLFQSQTPIKGLDKFWQALDGGVKNSVWPDKTFYSNYNFSPDGALPNQLHLHGMTTEMLADVRAWLLDTGFASMLMRYFKSDIGVCNVRAWRYLPGDVGVGEHHDRLTPAFLKVMIFRNPVTAEDGCFEYQWEGAWTKVVGSWPVLFVDTTRLRHRARAPKPGHVRDCIELTVIPRLEDDLPVINAGYAAGMPKNPFRKWDE